MNSHSGEAFSLSSGSIDNPKPTCVEGALFVWMGGRLVIKKGASILISSSRSKPGWGADSKYGLNGCPGQLDQSHKQFNFTNLNK